MTTLVITEAAVYADGRLAARVLWSGRMLKIESLRGKGLGRLLPAGYREGRPDDGSGLYDLWTALHPHVPVPSDRIIAEGLPLEDCVALLIEGAMSGARLRALLLLLGLHQPRAALGVDRDGRLHLRRNRLDSHREPCPPVAAEEEAVSSDRDLFDHVWYSQRRREWVTELRSGGEWTVVPVSSLVGRTLNVGDKNGGVYEGVTLTAFDERTGDLTLEGGICGSSFRPEEASPLERPERLWAHDVARGYVHHREDPS